MTRDDQSELPLLLLCAEENEVGLVRLVDELNRAGRAPEVISGVEDEAGLLTAATDRIAGPALFVLCRSPELAGAAVRRLSGLFSARRGPRHRLLVVDLSPTDPLAALPSIRAELEESRRASTESVGESEARAGRVPTRDVVSLPGMAPPAAADELAPVPSAEDVAQARAEALAKALHDEMVAAEAALSRRDAARSAGRSAADRPPAAGDAGEGVPEVVDEAPSPVATSAAAMAAAELARGGGPGEDSAASRAAAPVADLLDELMAGGSRAVAAVVGPDAEVGAAATPARGSSSPRAGDGQRDDQRDGQRDEEDEGGLLSSLAGVQVADPLGAVPVPDVVQTELTPTEFRKRRREAKPLAPDEPAAASRTSPVLFAVAVLAISALAFMAVMHLSRDPEPTAPRGIPATAAGVPEVKPTVETPAEVKPPVEPAPEVKQPTEVKKPEVEAPTVDPTAAGEDPPGNDSAGEASAGDEPDGQDSAGENPAGEETAGDPTSAGEDEPETPPTDAEPETPKPPVGRDVPPPPVDQEALHIDEAIRAGKIRAIDSLLVAKPGATAIDWDAATRTCKRSKAGGLGGWRLPGRRELSRLRRARMLGSAVYWSRERNDTKDEAHALDAGSGRSNLYLTIEPAARALCVRRR